VCVVCVCVCVCIHTHTGLCTHTLSLSQAIPSLVEPGTPPEVLAQQDRVRHVESLVLAHPIFARDDRKELLKVRTFFCVVEKIR